MNWQKFITSRQELFANGYETGRCRGNKWAVSCGESTETYLIILLKVGQIAGVLYMTDAEKVKELVNVLINIGGKCLGRYYDSDNDSFLYDTYQYIQNHLDRICGGAE